MKNISDEFVRAALGARDGEAPLPGNSRDRWGQRLALGNGQPKQKQFVATDVYPRPVPFAVVFRFSTDGVTFTPDVPATFTGGEVVIDVMKGIDPQSSPATERITLVPGDTLPFCNLIAQSLQIVAGISVEGPSSLWIECVAAIVSNIDCADVVGAPASVTGFTNTAVARFAALAASPTLYFPLPTRALFSIVNQSASNLFVALAGIVNVTPGTEFATVVLPPNAFAGYEVLNYRGAISFQFDADDAAGYALVTEGSYS